MSFLDKLSARMPFGKKEEVLEYFFALNISNEKLSAALWTIEGRSLKILEEASQACSSLDDLVPTTDKLLDKVLGIRELNVSKILFGVPSSWLTDGNLKEENLKVLRGLVKELELKPLAYVETAHALVHFLEKQDSIPPTAVLVGFEQNHLIVTVVRAGKLDGVKVVARGDSSGASIEKALLTFTNVETLPSKILLYGSETSELKSQLLSYAWMSKLSFLHFPKIEVLQPEMEIKSVCLAGASEIKGDVHYTEHHEEKTVKKVTAFTAAQEEGEANGKEEKAQEAAENLGFVVGDVSEQGKETKTEPESESEEKPFESPSSFGSELALPEEAVPTSEHKLSKRRFLPKLPKSPVKLAILFGFIAAIGIILVAYLFLLKAEVKVFVEPKVLEKETQVTADPKQKNVDEEAKIIPGQMVEVDVSGTSKAASSGKKQIGDPAKGTVIIYNKTSESKSLSKGTTLTSSGLKFTLDVSINIASQSASDSGITYGKTNATVTASVVGADSNLPSGSELTVGSPSSSQVSAKAEGNFSGGTSKDVTVVSDEDQKKLLASLASDLRRQARQKLQEKLPGKKILEEALLEDNVKKSYSKNINDQASEFSLNLTIHYKGTAFEDKDLKLIVGKLVTTQVPEGFELNLEGTETQANVSKLEKDGKLIFLAKFKAKLMPKINKDELVNKIKGKSAKEADKILKGMDNVLGLDIKLTPSLPSILQRLPVFGKNIKLEVGLK
ncbi:MAG: Uncharacterized protein G01um10147_582 [Microgenomates group bacterium Gr01-1014_7]|nr:MAG: Uncharacterized protein G01um10147_582 [Microgenomates group bacterium Gr01-1014_7]